MKPLSVAVVSAFMLLPQASEAQESWTPELSVSVKRLSDLAFAPGNKEILYGINTIDLENDEYLNEYVIADLSGNVLRTLIEPSSHVSAVQWSPDGTNVAYLSSETGHTNIWLMSADGDGEPKQVTDVSLDISSYRWAPDSQSFAFVMPDPDYIDPGVEGPDIFNRNHLWHTKLDGDFPSNSLTKLTADQDFTVSDWTGNWVYDWSPDSTTIAFSYQDDPGLDAMAKARLATVDVATLAITNVGSDDGHWRYFPRYSPDGKWLAFAEAPGQFKWTFLWDMKLRSVADGTITDLPKSKNEYPFPWEWASDSEGIYFVENDRSTYSFYRMPIDGSPPEKVFGSPDDLSVPGLNTYLVSPMVDVSDDGKTVAYIGQTYNKPPELYISDLDGFSPTKISSANQDFYDVPIGKTELIRWASLDGTEVEALLTYPVDFEEGESYPLAVQIHGGPNSVDFNEYLPLMKFFSTAAYSAKNYFILRINYRGSFGYGRKFREELVGNFGILDYQDIMSGVDHVIQMGHVEPEQMFVIGQSNGGTLTGWIITQTDRFKAACPIAGETDYISLEGTNGYFQTSWYLGGSFIDNLQTFLDRSPIFHVKNVVTPTLIQGGLLDDNVPHGQLKEFYRALKRVGVDVHLVSYPGADHDYYPPKLYLKLMQSCLDWTEKFRDKPTGN